MTVSSEFFKENEWRRNVKTLWEKGLANRHGHIRSEWYKHAYGICQWLQSNHLHIFMHYQRYQMYPNQNKQFGGDI